MTLQQRVETARDLRKQGYNCAQCVALVFNDVTGLDDNTCSKVLAGFGGGVGGSGEICGTITGLTMVKGWMGYTSPADKAAVQSSVKESIKAFSDANNGLIRCRDLKTTGRRPCMELIEQVITMLHNQLI